VAALLQVRGLVKRFGGVVALNGAALDLESGTVLGVIGPNGSGKTTLLNVLNGVYRPDAGNIRYQDQPVVGLAPHRLADQGMMRTFQSTRVFRTMTAQQNMLLPLVHRRVDASDAGRRARALLELVGLERFVEVAASELSMGQQRLLEFARALMCAPKLVLMDEPFAGVHPEVTAVMLERIHQTCEEGTAFVIVSHEIPVLMSVSRRVICLNQGEVIAEGTPEHIRDNPAVIDAYLGHGHRS
jgi:branched-chain amino acid transport system ATP-binding protein